MKNTLSDLNNYLFEQIERINDDSLTEAELETQLQKSEAINKIAKTIVDNASISFQYQKMMYENGVTNTLNVPMLDLRTQEKKKDEKNE